MNVALVGDVMVGRSFNEALDFEPTNNQTLSPYSEDLSQLLFGADVALANLETTLTNNEQQRAPHRTFHFRLNPVLAPLALAPFNVFSLANNHALDFGPAGAADTRSTLKDLGKSYAGTGYSTTTARRPAIANSPGGRVCVFSATDDPRAYASTGNKPGAYFIDWHNKAALDGVVAHVRDVGRSYSCNLLIFSVHWGANYVAGGVPPRHHRAFARRLVDEAGVAIVHGHSAHHVLPYEHYKSSIIFYSLGDFIDDYAIDEDYRNDLGAVALVSVHPSRNAPPRVTLRPTRIANMHTSLIPTGDPDYTLVLSRMSPTVLPPF